MDYKFIILAIVGIIIAYIIYSYAFAIPGKTLNNNTFLLNATTPIKFNTLGSDIYTSPSLSFYAWIYVNSPTPSNSSITGSGTPNNTQTLFYLNSIGGTAVSPSPTNDIFYTWALDTTGQNLYVVYSTATISSSTSSPGSYNAIKVLSNIPMQSWVFVAIVLDNTSTPPVMDVYMNGKLSSSIVLDSIATYKPPMPPNGMKSSTITSSATGGLLKASPDVSVIQYGSRQDVFIANLTAFKYPLTPDVVQSAYLSFAGKQNSVAQGKMGYGISFTKGSGRNLMSNDFQLW
jgi:hypothetical protein